MDYMNAGSMAQNQNQVPNNPFWSGMMGQRNQANAYPFMQGQFQNQQMDLQRKAMEQEEFASPAAREARQSGLEKTGAVNRADISNLPFKTDAEKQRYIEEIRSLPTLTDEKIAKAGEVIRNVKSQPHRELLANLGTLYDRMHQLPEDTVGPDGFITSSPRGQTYLNEIARFRMLNPGLDIPEGLRTYDPKNTMSDLASIRHSQLNSPEQVGKEKLAHITGGYALEKEGMGNRSDERRAEITAGASRYTADKGAEKAAAAETPAKAVARLHREIRANPDNQEAKDELSGYLNESFGKFLKDHPQKGSLDILAMQGMDNPNKQKQFLEQMQEIRGDYFKEHGIDTPKYEYRVAQGKLQRKLVSKGK